MKLFIKSQVSYILRKEETNTTLFIANLMSLLLVKLSIAIQINKFEEFGYTFNVGWCV